MHVLEMHVRRFADLQKYLSHKMDSLGIAGVACINDHINSSVVYY